MKKGNYFHLKKQKGAKEMANLKSKNFGKKLAAILLAATAVIVPAVSFCFANVSFAETEDLRVGDIISEKKEAWVVKETLRVKRWQEYSFKVYYEGVKNQVYVAEVHQSFQPMSYTEKKYITENQIINSYSLTTSVTETVKSDLRAVSSTKFNDFFTNLTSNIKVEAGVSYEKQVSSIKSITHTELKIETEELFLKVDGSKDNPFGYYYGDLLMMHKAHKFRVEVYEKQTAKHRSSGLAKWGPYVDEIKGTYTYYFYSSYYDDSANYYRKHGFLGDFDQYDKLITNYGK